ncbi:Myc-type, basic helix-loop-helix domain-containing protein [Pyronema omphalodes]|nr:Myc-type, basic helix-loop-helix domain-containing protein [Pyronema omphalodes]
MTLSPSAQALPSLSSLIQGLPSNESKSQNVFDSYQHSQHLSIPKSYDASGDPNGDGGGQYTIPSPISPRTNRCPSLSNSIYTTSASSSPDYAKRGFVAPTVPGVLRYTHDSSRIGKSPYAPIGVYGYHDHPDKISKSEKRRRNHLNSEKKRRENIKSGMDALFHLVPACRDQQESKANILKKTKDYIVHLQNQCDSYEREFNRLSAEINELNRLKRSRL